jgi:hypothetical protein
MILENEEFKKLKQSKNAYNKKGQKDLDDS